MSCLPEELPLHTDVHGAALPDAFGPFRVLHQIGVGALGPLFRAYDDQRDRLVAVKVFRLSVPPERLHQLAAEFEALIGKGLSHPGIAAPIAAGTDGIIVYLVREFVGGESLDIVLRGGARLAPEALQLSEGLSRALDYAAEKGVHHGALHPRDVLVSDGQVRLTDLGVCQAIEKVGVSAPIRRPYAAPERIAGAPWTRRADLFSLAVLMNEMLTGKPSGGPGAEAATPIPDVPGAEMTVWRAAFARALARDPSARFGSAREMIEVFQGAFHTPVAAALLLDEFPVESPSQSLPQPLSSRVADQAKPLPLLDSAELAAKVERSEQRFARAQTQAPRPVPNIRLQGDQPIRTGRSPWSIAAVLALGVALGLGAGYFIWRRPLAPQTMVKSQAPQTASFAPGAPEVVPAPVQSPAATLPPAPPVRRKAQPEPSVTTRPGKPVARSEKSVAPSQSSALKGELQVESRPAGAKVFLDDKLIGTTPLMLAESTAGQHAIRLELTGYPVWSSTARIVGGERTRITASFER